MRTWKWIFTAALLASLSAAAQQATGSQPSATTPAPDATQTAQPSQQAAPAAADQQTQPSQPASAQASQPAPSAQAAPAPPAVAPAPTTMDQVVNLFIEREHGLIKMLANRTPVVETYLQNLTDRSRNSAPCPAKITTSSAAWIWARPSTARTI